MKVGDLFVELGIGNADTPKAQEFADVLSSTALKAAGLVLGLVGVSLEFNNMVHSAMEAAESLTLFNSKTGLSTEELQRWQLAAERSGISVDAVSSSLQSYLANVRAVSLGEGGNTIGFKMLGINPIGKDAFEALKEIGEVIPKFDKAYANIALGAMGLSPEMIQLLPQVAHQLHEIGTGYGYILTEENQRKLMLLNGEFSKFREQLVSTSESLIAKLSPALIEIVKFLEHLTLAATESYTWLSKHEGVTRVFTALAVAAAIVLAYLFPITAAIIGILLAIEDLWTAIHGGDSVIGNVFGLFKTCLIEIDDLLISILDSMDRLTTFGGKLPNLGSFQSMNPVTALSDIAGGIVNFHVVQNINSNADNNNVVADEVHAWTKKYIQDSYEKVNRHVTLSGA